MTVPHITALASLVIATIILWVATGDNKDRKQITLLYSIQMLLVGILVCLIEIAWGGT